MPNETSPKPIWIQPFTLLVRATALLLLSTLTVFVLVISASSVSSPWLRILFGVLLCVIATATGLAGFASFSVAVIRWAALGMNRPQLVLVEARLKETNRMLTAVNDQLQASDVSKRITNRDRDQETLRAAIYEDIDRRELDSAMSLVKMMSQLYGRHEEAEEFREQIQVARAEEMELKVGSAIGRLDEILVECEWDKAAREAAKIQRQFPYARRVKQLNQRVREAREAHKRDLERQFLQAAERDDVDRAMELLRELDKYLTESEAGPFRETARGVIGKKRDNLGVQFKLAVHDREWTTAVRVGEQLIREFPNSKMADEVRGMLDVLRQHATTRRVDDPHQY